MKTGYPNPLFNLWIIKNGGKEMNDPKLTNDGHEVLTGVLGTWPQFIQEEPRRKLNKVLTLLMNDRNIKEADRELVLEAARLVLPPIFTTNIHLTEDPQRLEILNEALKQSIEEYYIHSIKVNRWDIRAKQEIKWPAEKKVLAICGSPRKEGNTSVLIDEVLRGAAHAGAAVEKVILHEIGMDFCNHCGICRKPDFVGLCVLTDGMSGIYQKIIDSTAIVVGFPIYMGRESAQMANFFDRMYGILGATKLGRGSVGLVIGVWGVPWLDAFYHVIERVSNSLYVRGIIPVEALSACGFGGPRLGLDDQGRAAIRGFPIELEKAYQAGITLVSG
jgi:hypothetical protein